MATTLKKKLIETFKNHPEIVKDLKDADILESDYKEVAQFLLDHGKNLPEKELKELAHHLNDLAKPYHPEIKARRSR